MNYEHEDQVISLKSMAFAVLRRWRAAIVVAMVLALVFGALRGVLTWRQLSDSAYRQQQLENYEQATEDYEIELERYTFQLEMLRNDIAQQQDYIQNSLLMQADYRSMYVATVGLYVYAENEGAEVAASIAHAYRIALLESGRVEAMAQAMDLEPRYLRELIDLPGDEDHGPLLTVVIRHSTREGAEKLQELLFSQLDDLQAQIQNVTCTHTAKLVTGGVNAEVDLELARLQSDENDRLEDYIEDLEDYLVDNISPVAPAAPDLGMGPVVKNAVIFAILGGVLGVILVIAWACVAYVLDDKVYSGEEIQGRLGLRLLGKLALTPRKTNVLDKWLDTAEQRGKYADPSAITMAAIHIRNHSELSQPVLVSSSADSETVATFVESLRKELPNLQIHWYGSLLENVEAVQQLPGCGSVLLVERCGQSRYTAIARQIEAVQSVNKKMIGVVALEQ